MAEEKESRRMTKRGQQRAQAMVAAAAKTFIEHGFEGTTLDMVIESSGGSRSTLYKTFGDKNGLFVAVIQYILNDMFTESETASANKSIESVLYDYGNRFMTRILEPDSIRFYRLIIAETTRFPTIGQQFYEHGAYRTYQLLANKLHTLPPLQNHTIDELLDIASHFLEMCKAELFMQMVCIPDYHVDPDLLAKRLKTSVLFTMGLLMPIQQPKD